MPDRHPNSGYIAVPLEAGGYAATVEVISEMVVITDRLPGHDAITLTRGEPRNVALAVLDASQQIKGE